MVLNNDPNAAVHEKLLSVYDALYRHNGFGEMTVEVRILKKQQKEILIKCGKQYRFVVDWMNDSARFAAASVHPKPAASQQPATDTPQGRQPITHGTAEMIEERTLGS